jgi:hypothetical protein
MLALLQLVLAVLTGPDTQENTFSFQCEFEDCRAMATTAAKAQTVPTIQSHSAQLSRAQLP